MKIPPEAHRELLALFERIAQEGTPDPRLQADIDAVRAAVAATPDGGAEMARDHEAYLALNRLLRGRPGFDQARALLQRARHFGEQSWDQESFGVLYDRSLFLRSISDTDLATPEAMLARLIELKPAIVEEQRAVRGVSEEKLPDYSYATLVSALAVRGRIPGDPHAYLRTARARDLYERSPLLQSIPDADLATPRQALATLARLKPAILAEQREVRGVDDQALSNYTLASLARALEAGGRLPGNPLIVTRGAFPYEMYGHSATLRKIPARALASPEALIAWLMPRRDIITQEVRRALFSAAEGDADRAPYPLASYVNALFLHGRLGDDLQAFLRFATARELYERSPILRGIDDAALASPAALVARLVELRPSIVEEQRRIRSKFAQPLKGYALTTLVAALSAGGRLTTNLMAFQMLAGARNLYDGMPALRSLTADDLRTPEALIPRLEALRTAGYLGSYALETLMRALVAGGRIAEDPQTFERLASAWELYQRSPLLRSIPSAELETPRKAIDALLQRRDAIVEEQRAIRAVDASELGDYSLGTLINALYIAGRLPGDQSSYARFASAREFYDRSPILQGISGRDLATPEALIKRLVRLKARILREQRAVRGVKGQALPDYSYQTLVTALKAGGKIPGKEQAYERLASGRDLYEQSVILRGLPMQKLTTPRALIQRLVDVREAIRQEQAARRGVDPQTLEPYALATFVMALHAGGRLRGDLQEYMRAATGRELYDRSPLLQGVPAVALATPEALLPYLLDLRPAIVAEQQAARGVDATKLDDYALATLAAALDAGGRLPGNRQPYNRLLSAYEVYDRSPTFRGITPAETADDESLMRFLLARRDRIAIENQRAIGRLEAGAFTFLGAKEHYALGTLIDALAAGGVLTMRERRRVTSTAAGPLEYFIRRRDVLEPVVLDLMAKGIHWLFSRHVDRTLFTWLQNPTRLLRSAGYINNITRWGRWFLTSPDIVVRSVFGGDEISVMAVLGQGSLVHAAPAGILPRLEHAAQMAPTDPAVARREAVEALADLLDHYDGFAQAGIELDAEMISDLERLRRLAEWNRDALGGEGPPPDGDPSPHGGEAPEESRSLAFSGIIDTAKTTVVLSASEVGEADVAADGSLETMEAAQPSLEPVPAAVRIPLITR